jgi:hypothetical protein
VPSGIFARQGFGRDRNLREQIPVLRSVRDPRSRILICG